MTKLSEQTSIYVNQIGKLKNKSKNPIVDDQLLKDLAMKIGISYYREYDFTVINELLISNIIKEYERSKLNFYSKNLDVDIKNVANSLKGRFVPKVIFYYLLVQELKDKEDSIKEEALNFGESLILSQEDIDVNLKKIVDNNFSSLL